MSHIKGLDSRPSTQIIMAAGAGRQTSVQEAFMQQIFNAQKHAAQHLTLPGADNKPVAVLAAKGLMDNFIQPDLKYLQEAKVWNQHPPHPFLAHSTPGKVKAKPEKRKVKAEKVKDKPVPDPVPSSSGSSGPENYLKDKLVNKLLRGRGRGSRRMGQLVSPRQISPRGKRRQFRCSYCDYASVRRYNTERHIRLRHPTYRYKCPLEHCSHILLDEAELRLHLQGHSGAALFLQCRECGVPCRDYDSLLTHQNSCPAVQSGEQDRGAAAAVPGSDNSDHIVVQLNEELSEDVAEPEQGGQSPGRDDARTDEDSSVEVVDDDNLPVHFMMKEEMAGSPASSS